jgi:hypothetical protein
VKIQITTEVLCTFLNQFQYSCLQENERKYADDRAESGLGHWPGDCLDCVVQLLPRQLQRRLHNLTVADFTFMGELGMEMTCTVAEKHINVYLEMIGDVSSEVDAHSDAHEDGAKADLK